MSLISALRESLGKEWRLDHISTSTQARSMNAIRENVGVPGSPRPLDSWEPAGQEGDPPEQNPKLHSAATC